MKRDSNRHETLNISHYCLFVLMALFLFFCFKMMRGYLDAVIIATLLAFITNPIYERIKTQCGDRGNLAAFIACILLTLVIVIPFFLTMSAVLKQGIHSFTAINAWIKAGNLEQIRELPWISTGLPFVERHLAWIDFKGLDLQSIVIKVTSYSGELLVDQGGNLVKNITAVTGKFMLMVFIFFFVVQDQKKITQYIFHLLPLSASHETVIVKKIKTIGKSAILGTVVTAAAQGFAGGLAFTICGLPGFFWGVVMAFTSLVPLVGTALIWVPAAGYLVLSGAVKSGIFMIVWSVVVVGCIDNFVRPLFMKGSAEMGTLIIFFSVLGGINYFGLTGLLYGPLVFGITMVLMVIYDLEFRSFLDSQDQN